MKLPLNVACIKKNPMHTFFSLWWKILIKYPWIVHIYIFLKWYVNIVLVVCLVSDGTSSLTQWQPCKGLILHRHHASGSSLHSSPCPTTSILPTWICGDLQWPGNHGIAWVHGWFIDTYACDWTEWVATTILNTGLCWENYICWMCCGSGISS